MQTCFHRRSNKSTILKIKTNEPVMYDSFLPLYNGAHPNIEPLDAHVEARNQPLQVHDQNFDDVHVDDVVEEERRRL